MAALQSSITEVRPTPSSSLQAPMLRDFTTTPTHFFTVLDQGPVLRGQFGQSLTISHPFLRRFTLSGEIWHFTQPFLRSNAVGNLWAVSYAPRKTLVFDAGLITG